MRDVNPDGLRQMLAAPFSLTDLKWKPQMVKGTRALAICYIDARVVEDRLDDVVGIENWKTEYTLIGPNSVQCCLSLRINGEWVGKSDVGSTSEQADCGDRMKAAYSDALKRAAIHWSIGRYLYRIPSVWADYDPQRKQFAGTPPLPTWALPQPTQPLPSSPVPSRPQPQPQRTPSTGCGVSPDADGSKPPPTPAVVEELRTLLKRKGCGWQWTLKHCGYTADEQASLLPHDFGDRRLKEIVASLRELKDRKPVAAA